MNVVLTGHEHFYERIKPQKGIAYFILGSSAKLRQGDLQKTDLTAKGWDQGYAFMLMEIAGDDLSFQTFPIREKRSIPAASIAWERRRRRRVEARSRSSLVRRQSRDANYFKSYPARLFDPMRYNTWWRHGSGWFGYSKSSAGL